MHNEIQLTITPEQAFKEDMLTKQAADKLEISPKSITRIRTLRKSIDSRAFLPKVNVTVEVYWDEMAPEQVLVIDAADMDLVPGEVRLIGAEKVEDPFLMTTHTLPLSYLVESLREFVPQVDLMGIQPQVVAFGYPVSNEVKQAVDQVYESLKQNEFVWASL